MCKHFKSLPNILRLLEIILCTLALVIPMFRGRMVNPYGIYCEFIWVFCVIVAVVLLVSEIMLKHVLLPNWDDLVCGLTMLCTLMVAAATLIFAIVFGCLSCISSVFCIIFSLAATVVFLVDSVKRKMKCPKGYLSNLRGILRFTEAVLACIILAGATNYFLGVEGEFRPPAMLCLLESLFSCIGMELLELVFNIVAVVLYLSAVILWPIFGYKHYREYNPPNCDNCRHVNLDVLLEVYLGGFDILAVLLYTSAATLWPVFSFQKDFHLP
ncbi:myeloid-associated differentiation marker homolog [Salmo salar]|uniref:Myeloid-associated differentiation marker homolog n=1 Tax=Salmo salar TaxID=8030 RepID=A0A1S3NH08_SALSA|nr:myeloid-associated differentiation marker homolog [Salmo salar]|eukprot:XP_014014672.1 PREDICTED: myeloid-associated differentiation marker homolog [Salmo salar]